MYSLHVSLYIQGVVWSCIRYMFGEIQYGGRVTDDYDKRLLNTFCKVWFSDAIFQSNFCFYKVTILFYYTYMC